MQENTVIRGAAVRLGSGQHKIVCPFCSSQRKKANQNQRTLSLKIDGSDILYNCWHCDENGIVPFEEKQIPIKRGITKMALAVKHDYSELSKNTIDWLKKRSISEDTAKNAGIQTKRHFINSLQKEVECVVFPYANKGKTYAAKIRALEDKGFSCNGAPANFFNYDNIDPTDDIFIVEGEMDALSFIEAGFENVVSVPNGAVMKVIDGKIDPQEDNKFKFLWDAKDKLEQAPKVILATDNDEAGKAMGEEIARRIGKDKCWVVEFPDGVKDANELLVKKGRNAFEKIIAGCSPYPVSGLYEPDHFFEKLDTLYEKGMGRGASTGYSNLDEFYSIVEGQLTVVTGHPSSGKSEFVDQLMVNLAEERGWKFAVCSFENDPPLHIAKLISKRMRKPFFAGHTPRVTSEELEEGKKFVKNHFSFLYQNDGAMATVDGIIERLKIAVMRQGVRGAVIDPYNYIQQDKGDQSETGWISDMLTKLRVFAMSHDLHLWFVAHPTKMLRGVDGKIPPPKGYDISGSAAWFAKADIGISVHRPDPVASAMSEVHVWKCRFNWVGKQGVAELYFDPVSMTYSINNDKDNFPAKPMALSEVPF